jgi:hypothetical protein
MPGLELLRWRRQRERTERKKVKVAHAAIEEEESNLVLLTEPAAKR